MAVAHAGGGQSGVAGHFGADLQPAGLVWRLNVRGLGRAEDAATTGRNAAVCSGTVEANLDRRVQKLVQFCAIGGKLSFLNDSSSRAARFSSEPNSAVTRALPPMRHSKS